MSWRPKDPVKALSDIVHEMAVSDSRPLARWAEDTLRAFGERLIFTEVVELISAPRPEGTHWWYEGRLLRLSHGRAGKGRVMRVR